MIFTKAFLLDRLGDPETTADNTLTGTTRWGTTRREVFRHEGRFYATDYRVGSGDEGETPYQDEGSDIECQEVAPAQRLVTSWEPV